jgi:hypothetical protein
VAADRGARAIVRPPRRGGPTAVLDIALTTPIACTHCSSIATQVVGIVIPAPDRRDPVGVLIEPNFPAVSVALPGAHAVAFRAGPTTCSPSRSRPYRALACGRVLVLMYRNVIGALAPTDL